MEGWQSWSIALVLKIGGLTGPRGSNPLPSTTIFYIMFKVFINASDSIALEGDKYHFIDYESFKVILNKLLINKISHSEPIELYYSEYITDLNLFILKYVEEYPILRIRIILIKSTIIFCKKNKMDGFIIFENDAPKQDVTRELKCNNVFRGITKRIFYIDDDGNIINYESI